MTATPPPAACGPDIASDTRGESTVETALIFSLAATLVVVMRSSVAMPLLNRFLEAARVIERALS